MQYRYQIRSAAIGLIEPYDQEVEALRGLIKIRAEGKYPSAFLYRYADDGRVDCFFPIDGWAEVAQ